MAAFSVARGERVARPLVDLYFDDRFVLPHRALIDTGALGIRLSAAVAREAGVRLPVEPTRSDLSIAGARSQAFERDVELHLPHGDHVLTWRTTVTFCDPWPHPFGLLGHRGFLDRFDLEISGRDSTFSLTPR